MAPKKSSVMDPKLFRAAASGDERALITADKLMKVVVVLITYIKNGLF